jgi:7-cyano-7-deazaguanine reductase
MLKQLDNSNISTHLGKSSQYEAHYNPGLLVKEPRSSNRTHLNIEDDNLPFIGYDTWNGYEVTALTNDGLPVMGICKFVYPCSSKYIVESKSVKLYFNSFSMTKLGNTPNDVLKEIEKRATKDLSSVLEADVDVIVLDNSLLVQADQWAPAQEYDLKDTEPDSYICLEAEYPVNGVVFDTYTETPELLEVVEQTNDNGCKYFSGLLRSRCRVTSQPDSGDVIIHIKGKKTVDPISLLKYIVSFRDECHFHEEICEAIYKRLWDLLEPDELFVMCLYARRGGWDINPQRASHERLLNVQVMNATVSHLKMPRQ